MTFQLAFISVSYALALCFFINCLTRNSWIFDVRIAVSEASTLFLVLVC